MIRLGWQILVIGYGGEHCTEEAYDIAYRVGKEVARRGAVLVTGGLGGVMEAASKGAAEADGLVVGIIPQDEKGYANPNCDIVIPTGIGHARDFITAYAADAVVVVGGGVGTMVEACAAYLKSKPIVSVTGSGGVADRIAGTYLDDRQLVRIVGEEDPRMAVEVALNLLNQRGEKGTDSLK
ncbi:MAG: TIGR00725 family protein [Candidatus Bathyarchaeia archaeon]